MPISCPLFIRNLTQPEFDERDAVVMRCAYAAQNALGRLCDERVYENDLALRLRAEGFASVHTQVPATVTHNSFEKVYRLDLIADEALYELKTVAGFVPQHDAQALHYAMLMGVNHGKLLNFRTGRVQGRLCFNVFLRAERRPVFWDMDRWRPLTPQCDGLKRRTQALIEDWGACLDFRLYEEALVHLCGGEAVCGRRVPVMREGVELGTHAVKCHGAEAFFLVTAFTRELVSQRSHIARLLELTGLRGVQWVNLNRRTAQFITIDRRMGTSE